MTDDIKRKIKDMEDNLELIFKYGLNPSSEKDEEKYFIKGLAVLVYLWGFSD